MSSIWALLSALNLAIAADPIISPDAINASTDEYMALLDCADQSRKAVLTKDMTLSAEDTVIAAIALCTKEEAKFRSSLRDLQRPALGSSAADDSIEKLRETLVDYTRAFFRKQPFADLRLKIATTNLNVCVRRVAQKWARLDGDPKSIGDAAVAQCSDDRRKWFGTVEDALVASGVRADNAISIQDKMLPDLQQTAAAWVLEEREKRLRR